MGDATMTEQKQSGPAQAGQPAAAGAQVDGATVSPAKQAAAKAGDFEAQEAALKPSAAPAPLTPPYPKLVYGAKGEAVTHLQNRLVQADQADITPDGSFGGGTHKAVVKFQSTRKMTADGVVGQGTWDALEGKTPAAAGAKTEGDAKSGAAGQAAGKDGASAKDAAAGAKQATPDKAPPKPEPWKKYPMLWRGYTGPMVKKMQTLLTASGYACDVSGTFDSATSEVLKKFQTDNGLKSDGLCGGSAWQKLFEKGGAAGLGPAEKDPPDARVRALIEGKFAGKGKYKSTGDGFADPDLDALLDVYGKHWHVDVRGKAPTKPAPKAANGGGAGGIDNSGKAVEGHPDWVQQLQVELYTSSEWNDDARATQKLIQAYLEAWTQESGSGHSSVQEFTRAIGASEENGQAAPLGGSKGGMNWCQDASTRALIYGLLRKGVRFQTGGARPKQLLAEVQAQVGAFTKWSSKASGARLYNSAAWDAPIYAGDQISIVGSGPLTGHAATAVWEGNGKIVYVSGNAEGGLPGNGSVRTDEVRRGTPPASYAQDRPKIESKVGAKTLMDTYANSAKMMEGQAAKAGNEKSKAIYEGEAARQKGLYAAAETKYNDAAAKHPDIPVTRQDASFKAGVHAPKTPGEVWVVSITRTSRLDANALLHMKDEALAAEGLERCEPMESAFPDYKTVFKD